MKFKETETVELKTSTSELKEAVISISAILNKNGKGKLYFGVNDHGLVIGQSIGKNTLRDVTEAISAHIEPKLFPRVTARTFQKKACILVEFEGSDSPYFAYGRAYMRVADENRQLSVKEIEKLLINRNDYRSKWEAEISDIGIKEARVPAIRRFVKRANDAGRMNSRYDNAKNVLNKLGLIKGNKLFNAARVLFSAHNEVEVQAAIFAGTEKITFLDIQNFRGNLFDLIEKSESYCREHMNWRADLSGSRRVEIPEIPVRAIREAIVNSLCHRDFSNPKGNEVAIFKDRIEIYNPGRFPEDHSPQEFITGKERSILRNPLVANVFFMASDIERWGSGLKRIHEACQEAKVKVAFENLKTGFLVTFYRPEIGVREIKKIGGLGEGVNEGVSEGVNLLFAYIRKNPGQRAPHISQALKVPQKTLERWLKKLKKERKIKYKGSAKTGGYWELRK